MMRPLLIAALLALGISAAHAEYVRPLPGGCGSDTAEGSAPALTVDLNGRQCNQSVALANETNPASTLTSGTATAITASNNFIASSITAGSVAVPSYAMTTVAGGNALNRRWRLSTPVTSGWGATLTINFWAAAPTYNNGDGAVYSVKTGGAGYLGSCSITLTQWGDAASGICVPTVGSEIGFVASGQAMFWDLQATSTLTKTSGQTFTLTAEVLDNKK